MSDEDAGFVVGMVVGFALGVILFLLFIIPVTVSSSHDALGSRGHACFANNTCRDGLRCLHGEGAEPGTCAGR